MREGEAKTGVAKEATQPHTAADISGRTTLTKQDESDRARPTPAAPTNSSAADSALPWALATPQVPVVKNRHATHAGPVTAKAASMMAPQSHGITSTKRDEGKARSMSEREAAKVAAKSITPASGADIKNGETLFRRVSTRMKKIDGTGATSRIGFYEVERLVGEGNFAKVKLARHALTGEKVAIKVIDKTRLDKVTAKKLSREVQIMKKLQHPNIVRLYEVIETPTDLCLIMEYASGGEIFEFLVVHGRMKEKDARHVFRQIIGAMDYCHSNSIIHRDLKAENLLLDNKYDIKIADFGFSNNFNPDGKLNTWCGSPPYAAPELFHGTEYVGPEVDIWSLGVVLYVLVCGALPFDGTTLTKLRARVLAGKFKIPFYMSTDCEKLLNKMLVVDPARRCTMDDIKNDKWINEGFENASINDIRECDLTDRDKEKVLRVVERIGIPREEVLREVERGDYNEVAATYNLLCHQLIRKKMLLLKAKEEKARRESEQGRKDGRQQTDTKQSIEDSDSLGQLRKKTSVRKSAVKSYTLLSQSTDKSKASAFIESIKDKFMSRRRLIDDGTASTGSRNIGSRALGVTSPLRNKASEPRQLRFSFSARLVSDLPAVEVMAIMRSLLLETNVKHEIKSRFALKCEFGTTWFEIEICKMASNKTTQPPGAMKHGLRFHRLSGPVPPYKKMLVNLVTKMEERKPTNFEQVRVSS